MNHIYALYKGEQNLADGTLAEIAMKTGKTYNTLKWMTYPSYNLIDLDAAKQMKRAASQLCVVFVPEREARRRVEEIARMKKTLHLSMSDFEDLCECIMPRLCGVCSGKNFRHCVWKEFLHRYQVEVVNYKADENTCPYSYPQAGWTVSKEWAEKIQKPFDGIVSDSDIDEEQPEDVSDSDERTEGR